MPRGTSYARTNGTLGGICGACDDGCVRSSGDVPTADVLSLLVSMTWALHDQCVRKEMVEEVTKRSNRVRQCASMTPRIAANHRSVIESIKSPIQAPTIAPAELGVQPRNQKLSPGLKWRYIIILPIFMDIPESMFISMPLSWATAPVIRNAKRTCCPVMRCMIGICGR
jgi:hypothetical protein